MFTRRSTLKFRPTEEKWVQISISNHAHSLSRMVRKNHCRPKYSFSFSPPSPSRLLEGITDFVQVEFTYGKTLPTLKPLYQNLLIICDDFPFIARNISNIAL